MDFKIKLADLVIAVHGKSDYLKEYCKDYLTDEDTELEVIVTEADILVEKFYAGSKDTALSYLEMLAMFRRIANLMPGRGRFLMHGVAVAWKGNGYLFTAPSGTGKSTHAVLWKKYLGDGVEIINGDKPILLADQKEIRVYGTPWAGKEGWQKNTSVPLKGICLLQRGEENQIKRIHPAEILSQLMQQVYYSGNAETAARTMELLDIVLSKVPVYQLKCSISEEAARCSFKEMVISG